MTTRKTWTMILLACAVPALAASYWIGHEVGFAGGRNAMPVLRPYPSPAGRSGPEIEVDVCLQTSRSRQLVEKVGNGILETIEGVVRESGDPRRVRPLATSAVYCDTNPELYVDILDSNQDVWRILYTAYRITVPNPTVPVGTHVTVKVRGHLGFGKAIGFVMSDALGPILMAEHGAFGEGLGTEDERPFTIRVGDAMGMRHEICGDAVIHAVEILGDSAAKVLPQRIGRVSLGKASYQFWNASTYSWINERCTDLFDESSWLLWRL